ncbi:hypothetical protein EIKCOROL_01570 [Eikenella corrodens ATCC 23834]|uniref:Uncharacterized protein n=1 Tax=Eikenella corrodens ATCC 23834 TaxID=546274 RepID=C0DW24_EIKCO|nr:hypothetical protein EIKCOROL_01570 [Eikenella corrodens ATCC 23834]
MAFSPCIGNSFAWLYKAAAGKQIGSGVSFLTFQVAFSRSDQFGLVLAYL